MSQFIKEFGIIDLEQQKTLITLVKKYIETNSIPLQPSQLYSSLEEKKFVDVEKRKSKYTAIVDDGIFSAAKHLVQKLNSIDKQYDFKLVENDVTYIEYKQGDFFKSHEDYLSMTSNAIEEFTLIMCCNADCEGGRTIFRINEFFTYPSAESCTPQHCVVFRKDLKHEGELIKSGTKEILTMNLLAVPKSSERVLVVKFEKTNQMSLISLDKIYSCGETTLKIFCDFCDETTTNTNKERIITYIDKMFTEKDFECIYRILNKAYISINDFKLNKHIIDYYQINVKNILLTEFNVTYKSITNTINFSDDFILNDTPEQTTFMLEIVKEQRLPYVPFKMVLVEGTLVYGGEASGNDPCEMDMSPVWISLSEYNNILLFKTLTNLSDNSQSMLQVMKSKDSQYPRVFTNFRKSGKRYLEIVSVENIADYSDSETGTLDHCLSEQERQQIPNASKKSKEEDDDQEDNDQEEEEEEDSDKFEIEDFSEKDERDVYKQKVCQDDIYSLNHVNFDLRLCTPNITNSKILNIMSRRSESILGTYRYPVFSDVSSTCDAYSLDKDGKMFLFGKQCDRAVDALKALKFDEKVKKMLNTTKFNFPQEKTVIDEHFCNESVYGKCTVLFITGFIRI